AAAPPPSYTLSLHDALPIYPADGRPGIIDPVFIRVCAGSWLMASVCIDRTTQISSAHLAPSSGQRVLNSSPASPHFLKGCCGPRSEEHTSELQSLRHLVCRL